MSFLIDENLSFRLKRLLAPAFPGCAHVADFGLLTADDLVIHATAKAEGLALLSKADDFCALVERLGAPPKLVFIRLGNATTYALATALIANQDRVRAFLAAPESDILDLT